MDILHNAAYLRNWLLGVASLRLLSVGLGYLSPGTLKDKVFNRASKENKYTDLSGRIFAVWTAVTCLVTVITALNLDNAALVKTCIATFVAANSFFALELFVYRTVSVKTVALPFVFATTSTMWLGLVQLPKL